MTHVVQQKRGVRWNKPHVGQLKCNLDASVTFDSGKTSFGALVRDANKSFVSGFYGFFGSIHDPSVCWFYNPASARIPNK